MRRKSLLLNDLEFIYFLEKEDKEVSPVKRNGVYLFPKKSGVYHIKGGKLTIMKYLMH